MNAPQKPAMRLVHRMARKIRSQDFDADPALVRSAHPSQLVGSALPGNDPGESGFDPSRKCNHWPGQDRCWNCRMGIDPNESIGRN